MSGLHTSAPGCSAGRPSGMSDTSGSAWAIVLKRGSLASVCGGGGRSGGGRAGRAGERASGHMGVRRRAPTGGGGASRRGLGEEESIQRTPDPPAPGPAGRAREARCWPASRRRSTGAGRGRAGLACMTLQKGVLGLSHIMSPTWTASKGICRGVPGGGGAGPTGIGVNHRRCCCRLLRCAAEPRPPCRARWEAVAAAKGRSMH